MNDSSPVAPEVINSLFQTACRNHQEGRLDEAKALYLKLLLHIDAPLLHYNLGLIHYTQQDFTAACRYFAHAHAGNPGDADSLFNLALCQKECGVLDEAVESYRKLLGFEPANVDALYNLAGCYREQRKDDQAIERYLQVLELAPGHKSANSNLAYMYQLTDDPDKAVHYYQRLLELSPGNEAALHMIDSLLGRAPESPPESYIRDLFDNYSNHYEESLVVNLHYAVPQQLRALFAQLRDTPACFAHGIDLGCGTGLSGAAFKDIVTVLDGVDLSAKMIAYARAKGIYRSLTAGSIASTLIHADALYDLVLAADVFAYVGDLRETFRLLSMCTRSAGYFCFSTEAGTEETYSLRPSGRFAHSPGYIRRLAEEFGWAVALCRSTDLRLEKGGWAQGNLWILQRTMS
jgi:predicted TPR repeat methyltransferase